MERKRARVARQLEQHSGEIRHVADGHRVAILQVDRLSHELRRIVGTKTVHHLEFSEGVARAEEGFGGLTRPELAAMPDDGRNDAGLFRAFGKIGGLDGAARGQGALRIFDRAEGVSVMYEKDVHERAA
jgi:hypothetical protein